MGYFSVLMKLFTEADDIEDQSLNKALSDILALIKNQRELRFLVDGTCNYGHQAGTVHIVKRLIDLTQFNGRIKVIYADADGGASGGTADKLALLLTGLDPREIDTTTIAYGTCKNIQFLDYKDRGTLVDEVRFGFTGGADDMTINFATELRVKYFTRLQPYLWDDDESNKADTYYESSRIEEAGDKYFYLVDEFPGFRRLAYKFPKDRCTAIDTEVWTWYGRKQTFDAGLKIRTNNVRCLYEACQKKPRLQMWPVYGLHHFRENVAEMVMNMIFSAFQAQQTIGKPILALFLNEPTDILHLQEYLLPFARDLADRNYDLRYFKAALAAKCDPELSLDASSSNANLNAFVAEIADQVRTWINVGSKLTFLTAYGTRDSTYFDISGRLTTVIENVVDNEIIVALIGTVPVDIFNYFYATCQIPGVFEGQSSSSLAISLGRAFLQIPRRDDVIHNTYPSFLMGNNHNHSASTASDAALQLRDQQYKLYLRSDGTTDPKQYFAQLSKTSRFIINTQDKSSDISAYFTALGNYFQKDIHDKFLLGLVAQAVSI